MVDRYDSPHQSLLTQSTDRYDSPHQSILMQSTGRYDSTHQSILKQSTTIFISFVYLLICLFLFHLLCVQKCSFN
jgi:hypothetical protein